MNIILQGILAGMAAGLIFAFIASIAVGLVAVGLWLDRKLSQD